MIRIATIDAPHFACGAVDVGRSWSAVDLTGPARDVLLVYVGRILQVHPADVTELGAFGLGLDDGRLIETGRAAAPAPTTDRPRRR